MKLTGGAVWCIWQCCEPPSAPSPGALEYAALYVDRENIFARSVYHRVGMDHTHYLIYEQDNI